jgi:hypothetical protein
MWMVPVEILCRKHLMGEHVETHMFLGSLQRKRKIDGFVRNNCAQPLDLLNRHDLIAEEMTSRGYNHKSPLLFTPEVLDYLPDNQIHAKVDVKPALEDLINRCSICRERYENYKIQ